MNEVVTKASDSNIVLWVTIVTVVVGILARSFSETLRKWADERRRMAVERDDADIADLKRQVQNLQQWRTDQETRNRDHTAWDRRAYTELVKAGIDIDPPPSLF